MKRKKFLFVLLIFSSRPDDQIRNVESNGRIILQSFKRIHAGALQRWKHDLPVGERERLSWYFPGVFPGKTRKIFTNDGK